jgi:hypothetical protein
MPLIPHPWEAEIRKITVQSQSRQIVCETLSRKNPNTKKGCWSGSSVRMLSKCKALSSNCSTTKKEKKTVSITNYVLENTKQGLRALLKW